MRTAELEVAIRERFDANDLRAAATLAIEAYGGEVCGCNAVTGPQAATITVQVPVAPGVALNFAGNRWDHPPPRIRRRFEPHRRAEVVLASGPAAVDVSRAVPDVVTCDAP